MGLDEQQRRVSSDIILENVGAEKTKVPSKENVVAYLIDFMALIGVCNENPLTYEDLTVHLIQKIPIRYQRVHKIRNIYLASSIRP